MNLEPVRELVRLCQKIKRLNDGGFPTKNTETNLYYAAYEAGPALSQLLEAVTWIKCSERMPDAENCWVLVYEDGAINCMAWDRGQWKDWTYAALHNINPERITHWMPLPSPPEDK